MSDTWTVAGKELLDLRRDRLFAILIAFLAVATLISVAVASADFRNQQGAYNLYVANLVKSGTSIAPAAPQLFPLKLLRGGIEYLEILGALFAIVLGYETIAKEKHRGTLALVLSRPLGRFSFAGGKMLGLSIAWLGVVSALTVVSLLAVVTIGQAPIRGSDVARLLVSSGFAWLYLVFWTALTVGLTALSTRLSTGLILALIIWLAFVLIIPQIGDTMDPDNQVPGGLFATLRIKKPDELAVLAQFSAFDGIRNGLEVSSVTKHFERLTFAFLGIKDQYNQQPLDMVWVAMLPYSITLTAATFASVVFAALATTRRTLQRTHS